MITELLFEKIPRFFAFLYRLICESFVFTAAKRAWRAICREFSSSAAGRLLTERKNEGEAVSQSLLFRILDGVGRGIVKLLGKVIDVLTFGSRSFTGTRLLAKLRELYGFLDFEFLVGVSLWFFILCPGPMWHNVYGLAAAIFLLGVELILMAADKREYVTLKRAGTAFFAFVLTTLVSVISAGNRPDAMRVFVFYATSFIMTLVVIGTATDKDKLKKILGFIYTAVILTAIYAFYQRAIGVEVSASLTDLTLNATMPGRVFSTFENPNNYAELLVLTMPISVVYCTMIKQKRVRAAALLLELLPFAAILMTYSRSGWISFALSVVIFIYFYDKKLLPVLLLVGICVIPFLPSSVTARIATIGSTKDSSNHYRIYIWEAVMKMLDKDVNWLTGVGLGPASFREVYLPLCDPIAAPAQHAHMLYLETWIEQGIFGVLSYLAMLFSAVRRSLIAMKYASREVRLTVIACIASLGGIAFASAAEYIWYYPRVMVIYFVVLGLLYACINIAEKERK